jgi:biuret amidohydrolase
MLHEPLRRDAPYVREETALILVDMQRAWLDPCVHSPLPGLGDYFYRAVWQRVIPNQRRLLKAARGAGIEVLYTIVRSLTRDGRDRSLDYKLSSLHLAPDDPDALPVSELAPQGDEIVLPKTSSGVFNSTNLNYLLRNLGIRYLIVAGAMTDQCVDMTVRDGADLGYLVTCVSDACAAPTQERHENGLKAFSGYCWLTDTETVLARLDALINR